MTEVIAKVWRGETLESEHHGTLVVLEGGGRQVAGIGDVGAVTFWRSAAKALQAVPFITSGAADAYGFSEKELALACASHSGEDFHTDLARRMLERAGFAESDLRCGAHAPFHEETARDLIRRGAEETQLHNNCSGKHAAMLAFAKHIGANPETYLEPDHPVQRLILETVSLFTDVPAGEIAVAVDGCSAPNFAVPLRSMALAYAKLIRPEKHFAADTGTADGGTGVIEACRRIVKAKMRYPEYVGGSYRLDTKIMRALPGRIVCKVGAEGVWVAGIMPSERWPEGLAVALKIGDGDDGRARPAAAVELLRRLGVMTGEAEETLGEFSPLVLKNRRGIEVGRVTAELGSVV